MSDSDCASHLRSGTCDVSAAAGALSRLALRNTAHFGATKSRAAFSALARCFLAALFLCLACQPALAALKAKKTAASLEEATNPQPAENDIMLPMPCGASMVLLPVATQAKGFLWDMQTQFGCDECDRQDQDYYERRYGTAVSGPFSANDLPSGWQKKLPKAEAGEHFFYLIGKYEVSNFQWKAVMEGWCPSESSPLAPDDARPKTDISWMEAVNFSAAYTEWLLKNAPEALPRFAGDSKNIGYLRLPTEAEWEYAARGGHAVPRASLREQEFFPMEQGLAHSDYAVFRGGSRASEDLQPIGSRRANPLGLYDTAGNAAEMVLDNFHFSLGGRLHGSAGGFVRKGGSFLSSLSEILPGRREETAQFIVDGPNRTRDMGFRLALSGINTPSGQRPGILNKEWRVAGEGQGLLLDQGKNPLEELDRLIGAAANPQEKENLSRLRGILKDNNIALERQNEAAAEELIRSALFMVETVRNYGVRHKLFMNMIAENKADYASAKKKGISQSGLRDLEETIAMLEKNRLGIVAALDAAIGFYRNKVEDSQNYPEALFDAKIKLLGAEFKGDDLLAKNMREAHAAFVRHVGMVRKGKRPQLTRDYLVKDILPENLRDGLI